MTQHNHRRGRFRSAFTLVELLCVIGIIALLLAMLFPAISAAVGKAKAVTCANNLRGLCQALYNYAAVNKGELPPNISPPKAVYWYDADRLGKLMNNGGEVLGRAVTCPEDPDSQRSYAMNVWASSITDKQLLNPPTGSPTGVPWSLGTKRGERLILVAERWSTLTIPQGGWASSATVGIPGTTPASRFGANGGVIPAINANRYGTVNSELAYQRHRMRSGTTSKLVGCVNIGYADGHVALKSNAQLINLQTNRSSLDSLWSPLDPYLNN